MTFIQHLNEFRRMNGVNPVPFWNSVENWHCELHASYMIRCGVQHSPSVYLCGKLEAVSAVNFLDTWEDTFGHMIFITLGQCPDHRNILLMQSVAYGIKAFQDTLYGVVRGW